MAKQTSVFEPRTFYDPADVSKKILSASARNESYECSLSELGFSHKEGLVFATLPDARVYALTLTAAMILCAEAGIPFSYYLKISDDLKIKNLQDRLSLVPRERRLLLNNEHEILRGAVSTSYLELSNADVVENLNVQAKAKLTPLRTYFKQDLLEVRSLQWRVVLDEIPTVKDKSKNFIGFNLSTSELGGFFSTLPITYRLESNTALIVTESLKNEAYRVSYRAMDQGIAKGLVDSIARVWTKKAKVFEDVLNKMQQNSMVKEEVLELLQQMEDAKVSRKFVGTLGEAFTKFPIEEWEVVNTITRKAQELSDNNLLSIEATVARLTGLTAAFSA